MRGAEYQGLGFDVADRAAREDALRPKAVESAPPVAPRSTLRGAAMKLGPLQSIQRRTRLQPAFRPLMELARGPVGSGAAKPPPIEPGLITLTETVSASWALAA